MTGVTGSGRGREKLWLFLFVFVCFSAILSVECASYELLLTQEINRHGDRTPTHAIAIDPAVWDCTQNTIAPSSQDGTAEYIQAPGQLYRTLFIDNRQKLLGNCMTGQLTSIGEQQTRSLGSQLHNIYVKNHQFLSPSYNSTQIYVRASDKDRCIQTARNIIDSIYPPNQGQSQSLVIPIWMVEHGMDDMEISIKSCPAALEAVIKTFLQHPDDIVKLLEPLLPHLVQLKKIYNTSRPIIAALKNYDNCNCRVKHNMSLPNGMSMNVFNAIQKSYWFGGEVLFNSTAPLTIADFVEELIQFMEQKISGNLSYRFQLFSGHDTTVGPMLSLLGVYDGTWPPYASHIILSLVQETTTKEYFVQVMYDGTIMKLPGCGYEEFCSFETFKALVESQLPSVNACSLLPRNRISDPLSTIADSLIENSDFVRKLLSNEEPNNINED